VEDSVDRSSVKQRHNQDQRKNKTEATSQNKTKPQFERMSNTTTLILGVAVPLLLSGFANYFAHKSWILYLPLIGFLLLVGYLGHLAIRSYAYPIKQLDKTTDDNVRREQRARIAPIAFGGEPKVNESFTTSVRYKNTGKTFAKHVSPVVFAYGVKKGEKPDTNIVENEPNEEGVDTVMAPGVELTSYHTYNEGKPLTEKDVTLVDQGKIVIYFFGKIHYRDEFQSNHWTKFCVFFNPKLKRYSDCWEYNDTDKEL
jgi:hypothetical protein